MLWTSCKTAVLPSPMPTGCPEAIESSFLFKRKAAYEIVAGDWSSDVCSSDLPSGTYAASTLTDTNVDSILDPVALKAGGQVSIEIGRASCRERVSYTV